MPNDTQSRGASFYYQSILKNFKQLYGTDSYPSISDLRLTSLKMLLALLYFAL